ncbi:MAG: ribbon-helix-helix protein, CopG family [Gemmatimonadaceae bacterium]|nr:ribbon-helix-helix protein, CopG family [Gemmatimonadaceae bacterium]
MKTKTSITLSADILASVDRLVRDGESRSAFIERALRDFVSERQRARADAKDLAILNRHADSLNAEAADVLGYQAAWLEE